MLSQPLAAQDDQPVTDAQEPSDADVGSELETTAPRPAPEETRRPRERINLSITVPKDDTDEVLEERCEREADVGRVQGEIVVCRALGQAIDCSFEKEEWEQD